MAEHCAYSTVPQACHPFSWANVTADTTVPLHTHSLNAITLSDIVDNDLKE